MALFKKPKKNIRTRNVEKDDDEFGSGESALSNADENESSLPNVKILKKKDKEKDTHRGKQITLLSFGDEEEDGEVFQIKKSSHSKKLVRLLDRERRKKKEKQDKMDIDDIKLDNNPEIENDDFVVVLKTSEEERIRQAELLKKENKPIILNGRAALAAGKDDMSSSDDEGSTKHKFSQPDHAKFMIESGKIPDAATIHAARKRRQRARELGADYIPVETTQKFSSKNSSRLVREDNDGSDEDEKRIDMSVHLETQDREHQLEHFYDEETPGLEDDEWESQQIRKGVTGVAVSSSQSSTAVQNSQTNQTLFNNIIAPQNKELPTPQYVIEKVKERLNALKEVHSSHLQDKVRAEEDASNCLKETTCLETEAPGLADKFRFYQEMRGYVTDLVECLDEKIPGLIKLEEKAHLLWTERAEHFIERRRQDVRDQADEMSPFAKNPSGGPRWSKEEEEARSRRAAEREGRRTRRRRTRELKSISSSHIDGMSSDDEQTESEITTFKLKLEEVNRLGEGLLADVEDDFGTIDGIASRLELWRKFDFTAYTEAYASLCLPKLVGPLVRFNLLTWNPIQGDTMDLESTRWWGRLLLYGIREKETCETLASDPDILLVPLVIERVVIPKVTQLVKSSWDPVSSTQTLRLVGLLGKYTNETPTLGPKSRQLENLLQTIIDKLKGAVDNDVFIPINIKVGGELRGNSSVFFQRQFASAVKLLRNILSFHGLIGSEHLQEIALDSLLNRYLMAALRICSPCEAINKANMIISTFPRWWFQKEMKIKRLEMFSKHLKHLSLQIQENDPSQKESYELVHRLVRTIEVSCPKT